MFRIKISDIIFGGETDVLTLIKIVADAQMLFLFFLFSLKYVRFFLWQKSKIVEIAIRGHVFNLTALLTLILSRRQIVCECASERSHRLVSFWHLVRKVSIRRERQVWQLDNYRTFRCSNLTTFTGSDSCRLA